MIFFCLEHCGKFRSPFGVDLNPANLISFARNFCTVATSWPAKSVTVILSVTCPSNLPIPIIASLNKAYTFWALWEAKLLNLENVFRSLGDSVRGSRKNQTLDGFYYAAFRTSNFGLGRNLVVTSWVKTKP